MAQEVLHRVGKWLVKVLGKGGARVVGQYTDEHNGIVLDMRAGVVFFGEEGADLSGGGGCSSWACDGGLDNGRQVEHFFALSVAAWSVGRETAICRQDIPS